MAGYVIHQCPSGGDETGDFPTGIGGFTTSGFNEIFDWLEHSADAFNPALANGGRYVLTLGVSRDVTFSGSINWITEEHHPIRHGDRITCTEEVQSTGRYGR